MSAWMRAYRASRPSTEGVRMRLPVTVWNMTVEAPLVQPTHSRAPSLGRRKGRTRTGEDL